MKQSNPQYSNTGDSSTDKSRKSKPVGFRYKNVDKDSKLYYKTPSDSLVRKFEKGDESAREKIYFEKRQDHSDKSLSGRTFAEGGGVGNKIPSYIKIEKVIGNNNWYKVINKKKNRYMEFDSSLPIGTESINWVKAVLFQFGYDNDSNWTSENSSKMTITYGDGGGVGDKDKYIKLYNERIDKAIKDSIKQTGEQTEDSWEWIDEEGGFTAEEIVGYYLEEYKDEALSTWLENVKHSKGHDTDEKVTKILKEVSGVSYAKGGGVNKIKDIDINSVTKIPNEVYFKGKRYIGKAGFINGFNGYESSKDDGMLCAYTQEEGYDKEKLSLWNNNSKPNYLTDKDGSKIMSKNYRGNSIAFEENGVRKFNEGGGVSALEYSEIYEVLKDKIESVVEDIDFENSSSFKGEEVEHKSRDGFWAYTDGGFEAVWFEYNSQLEGSGNKLPTKPLQTEMQRQISYGYELAKEEFVKKYPEIVEELGEDNIDYHTLQESGYEDEAEELSEMEQDGNLEDTVQMKVLAYYYNPENSKGKDGKHTISLQADVNLESPYHRSGNLDDGKEIIFTFDSMDELSEKMDSGLQEILAWFNGSDYNTSTTEMKVRRMAKGGGMKRNIAQDKNIKALHAGKRTSADGNIYYENRANRSDLNRTKRFGEGGGFVDLHKKEVSFLKDKGYDIGNGDYVLFNTLDGEEGIEAVQGNKGIIPNIEYAVAYFIDDNSDVLLVTKKLLRKIKKDFGMGYTLYTNAGVEIHHTELHKGKFEDIKIVRVPYDEMIKFKVGGGVRSSNKNSRSLVLARTPFNANNLSGELVGDVFVVKSYGYYPVFVYKDGKWYENDNKYSPSTAKQMTQARPTSDAELLNVEELKALYSFEDGGSMGTSELKSIENSIENYLSMNQEVGVDMLTIYLGRKPNYEENVVGYKIRKKLLSPYFKRVS